MSHSPARIETRSFEVPARLVHFIHGLVGRSNQTDSLAEAFREGLDRIQIRLLYESSSKVFDGLRKTLDAFQSESLETPVSMTTTRWIVLRLSAKEYAERDNMSPNELLNLSLVQYLHGH